MTKCYASRARPTPNWYLSSLPILFWNIYEVQAWRSGESARLPPRWIGFDLRPGVTWVEFVVGPRLRVLRFSSLHKKQHLQFDQHENQLILIIFCVYVYSRFTYFFLQKIDYDLFFPAVSSESI